MLRIEKRLFAKKRFRRIAGAVAGSATALTFLHTRLSVSLAHSPFVSVNDCAPIKSLAAPARFPTAPHRRAPLLSVGNRSGIRGTKHREAWSICQ